MKNLNQFKGQACINEISTVDPGNSRNHLRAELLIVQREQTRTQDRRSMANASELFVDTA
jgi:hypothetical protein